MGLSSPNGNEPTVATAIHRYRLPDVRLSIESSRTLLEIASALDFLPTVRILLPTPLQARAQSVAGVQPLEIATLLLPIGVSAPHAQLFLSNGFVFRSRQFF